MPERAFPCLLHTNNSIQLHDQELSHAFVVSVEPISLNPSISCQSYQLCLEQFNPNSLLQCREILVGDTVSNLVAATAQVIISGVGLKLVIFVRASYTS